MYIIASKRNGKCLSERYKNAQTKLRWKCSKGHQWEATPNNIKNGKWCPECSGTKRLTIEEMNNIAQSRSGRCLSKIYLGNKEKLLWECSKGHRWEAIPHSVKRGSWCPHCAGRARLTLEEMHLIAKKRGGKCLSEEYVNSRTKLLWECSKGHQWKAAPEHIKEGTWCPTCSSKRSGKLRSATIEDIHKIALERGGKCLSRKYVNSHSPLSWECASGHRWESPATNIKSGNWCPECSSGLGERICRDFFIQLFKEQFPKVYPEWLINVRGNRLELDGYSKSLNLAFEHHGQQHYKHIPYFMKSEDEFLLRQKDDEIKKLLCGKNNVTLIEIPELFSMTPLPELKNLIVKQCLEKNIFLPDDYESFEPCYINAYKSRGANERLLELSTIAHKRGGKCLSPEYINNTTKLLWECSKGHQWKTTPTHVKQGKWCPTCAGRPHLTIEDMRMLANKRGGKCLSKDYVNNRTKLLWECSKGHQWEAIPNHKWCSICSIKNSAKKRSLTIESMHSLAKERGGKCLSGEYVNARTTLLWECKKGHQWENSPGHIKQGQWCPECSGKARLTIKEMGELASKRGGRCLSTEYKSSSTKLLWQCSKGHQWKATPNSIKRGSWCRECYLNGRQNK